MRLRFAAPALVATALVAAALLPAPARAQKLEACARGNVQVCFTLLDRPRLDPGRRAAIQFLLAELETLLVSCANGETDACRTLSSKHPDLPADLRARNAPPAR